MRCSGGCHCQKAQSITFKRTTGAAGWWMGWIWTLLCQNKLPRVWTKLVSVRKMLTHLSQTNNTPCFAVPNWACPTAESHFHCCSMVDQMHLINVSLHLFLEIHVNLVFPPPSITKTSTLMVRQMQPGWQGRFGNSMERRWQNEKHQKSEKIWKFEIEDQKSAKKWWTVISMEM